MRFYLHWKGFLNNTKLLKKKSPVINEQGFFYCKNLITNFTHPFLLPVHLVYRPVVFRFY